MTVEYAIRICSDCKKDCTYDAHLMPGSNRRYLVRCSRCRARVEAEQQ